MLYFYGSSGIKTKARDYSLLTRPKALKHIRNLRLALVRVLTDRTLPNNVYIEPTLRLDDRLWVLLLWHAGWHSCTKQSADCLVSDL